MGKPDRDPRRDGELRRRPYGVPWQYSGKEVQVRLCSGHVEIYCGEVLLARHKAQYRSGSIIYLQGQYEGLSERKGIATPFPCAQQRNNTVEVRELRLMISSLEVSPMV
jgi:hypothetical protein